MSGILSYITRSEIMTGAHRSLADNRRYGRQLAHNARTIAWEPRHARALAEWRPLSLSEALKAAWQRARWSAEARRIELANSAEAILLRDIERRIENLDGRDRWDPNHYAAMASLRAAHTVAFEAARTAL